jgi:hypothetical protein
MKLNKGKDLILAPDIGKFRRTSSDEQKPELLANIKDVDSGLMPLPKQEFGKLALEFTEILKLARCFNQQT